MSILKSTSNYAFKADKPAPIPSRDNSRNVLADLTLIQEEISERLSFFASPDIAEGVMVCNDNFSPFTTFARVVSHISDSSAYYLRAPVPIDDEDDVLIKPPWEDGPPHKNQQVFFVGGNKAAKAKIRYKSSMPGPINTHNWEYLTAFDALVKGSRYKTLCGREDDFIREEHQRGSASVLATPVLFFENNVGTLREKLIRSDALKVAVVSAQNIPSTISLLSELGAQNKNAIVMHNSKGHDYLKVAMATKHTYLVIYAIPLYHVIRRGVLDGYNINGYAYVLDVLMGGSLTNVLTVLSVNTPEGILSYDGGRSILRKDFGSGMSLFSDDHNMWGNYVAQTKNPCSVFHKGRLSQALQQQIL